MNRKHSYFDLVRLAERSLYAREHGTVFPRRISAPLSANFVRLSRLLHLPSAEQVSLFRHPAPASLRHSLNFPVAIQAGEHEC